MRTARKLSLAITGIFVGLAGVPLSAQAQKPSTNAHTLLEWVQILDGRNTGSPDYTNAELAIRYLGTNAIPQLLAWISYNPPDRGFDALHARTPTAYEVHRQSGLANDAVDAFGVLGPVAAPAVPALSNLVVAGATSSSFRAIKAMSNIGPPALPTLIAILTNSVSPATAYVPGAIQELGTNARPAVPALMVCLTNATLRAPALNALTWLALEGVEPDRTFPAIANLLSDPDPNARASAVRMLALLSKQERKAWPLVLSALKDRDEHVRTTAAELVRYMAPNWLTNSPAH